MYTYIYICIHTFIHISHLIIPPTIDWHGSGWEQSQLVCQGSSCMSTSPSSSCAGLGWGAISITCHYILSCVIKYYCITLHVSTLIPCYYIQYYHALLWVITQYYTSIILLGLHITTLIATIIANTVLVLPIFRYQALCLQTLLSQAAAAASCAASRNLRMSSPAPPVAATVAPICCKVKPQTQALQLK